MSTRIDQLMDALPAQGLTVQALKTLDFVAPGQWVNINRFDNMIRVATGRGEEDYVARVRERALALYADESQGYQRAVQIYQLVDSTDTALGAAALAHKAGELFSALSFLRAFTPKADTSQAVDLAMKIIAEVMAFRYINSSQPGGVGDFVQALSQYERENLIRVAAILTFDGLVPLGPDFSRKLVNTVHGLSLADLERNSTFQRIRPLLPGDSSASMMNFIGGSIDSLSSYTGNFAGRYGVTSHGVLRSLRTFIDFADDKLDYVAGLLDMSTNYMEHTGIQSVARSVITRAAREI